MFNIFRNLCHNFEVGLFEQLAWQYALQNFFKTLIITGVGLLLGISSTFALKVSDFTIPGTSLTVPGIVIKSLFSIMPFIITGLVIFNSRATPYKRMLIWLLQQEIKPKSIKEALIPLIETGVKTVVTDAKGIESPSGVHVLWEFPNNDSLQAVIRNRVTTICTALVPYGELASSYFATETISPRFLAPLGHEKAFRKQFDVNLISHKIQQKRRLLILPYCDFMAEIMQGRNGGITDAMTEFTDWNIKTNTDLKIMVYFDTSTHQKSQCLNDLLGQNGFWNFAIYGNDLVFANRDDTIRIMEGDSGKLYRSIAETIWEPLNKNRLGKAAIVSDKITKVDDLDAFRQQITEHQKEYLISVQCTLQEEEGMKPSCKLGDLGIG